MESVKLDYRPELPALESVAASLWGDVSLARMRINRVVTALLILGISGLILYPLHMVIVRVAEEGIASYGYVKFAVFILFSGSIISATLYHSIRMLRSDIYWKTDSRGLTAYRLKGSRRLEWTEVTHVSTSKSSWGLVSHNISSDRSIFSIPDGYEKRAHLAASVWQHLNLLGKAENMKLQGESASFWEPIPDVVPYEMDLKLFSVSTAVRILGWSIAITSSLAVAITVILRGYSWTLLYFVSAILFVTSDITTIPYQANRFRLRQDHFEAETGRGLVRAVWSEVTDASWHNNMILLQTPGNRVYVRVMLSEKESAWLILRIIERLRTIEHPILLTISKDLKERAVNRY